MYLEAEKQMKMFKSCLTTQEIFSQQKNSCQGLTYRRIPIPDFCAPKEQVPQGWDGMVLLPPSQASPDAVGGMSLGCSVLVGCLPRAGVCPGDAVWRGCVPSGGQGSGIKETGISTWRL